MAGFGREDLADALLGDGVDGCVVGEAALLGVRVARQLEGVPRREDGVTGGVVRSVVAAQDEDRSDSEVGRARRGLFG